MRENPLDLQTPVYVEGRVSDRSLEDFAIVGAEVVCESENGHTRETAVTSPSGHYGMKLPPARYRCNVYAEGYEPYDGDGWLAVGPELRPGSRGPSYLRLDRLD